MNAMVSMSPDEAATFAHVGMPAGGYPRPAASGSAFLDGTSAELLHIIAEVLDIRSVFSRISAIVKPVLPHDALDLQFAALVQNPHALSIHQAIWRALAQLRYPSSLVDRYSELTRHAVFYLDPHVCMRCRYRSTELLWQCPHCHDWNTFVEERIAPAQDPTEVEV